MDTDIIVYIKRDNIYKDIAEDFETRLGTLNNELERPLPKEKYKKGNWINKRSVRWENDDKICWISNKNLYLINRWRKWRKKSKRYKKICHKKRT